jgi:murein DD-endopeptidase MepM/ murein hydrolase activator NlpD
MIKNYLLLIFIFCSCHLSAKSLFVEVDSVAADLKLVLSITDDSLFLKALNQTVSPLSVYIYSKKTDSLYKNVVVSSLDSIVLFRFDDLDKDKMREYLSQNYHFTYFFGDYANIKHDDSYVYRLPFKKGKKIEVSQGIKGKYSHNHIKSLYAIDFQLEVGEPVYAARGGKVVRAIDWFKEAGGRELMQKANRIVILHNDGTLASYVHLDYQGTEVKEGDYVKRGQLIGYSGLTGFTRGPHLHFVVRKEKDIAVPVHFEGYEKSLLKTGKRVKVKR